MADANEELDILLGLLEQDEDATESKNSPQSNESNLDNNELVETPKYRDISDPDFFLKSMVEVPKAAPVSSGSKSLVHAGDTDSSDDEDNRYAHEAKYDSYGKSIKHMLAQEQDNRPLKFSTGNLRNTVAQDQDNRPLKFSTGKPSQPLVNGTQKKEVTTVPPKAAQTSKTDETTKKDLYAEPISGIRIVNPTLPFQELRERMIGRQEVRMHSLKHAIEKGSLGSDWFTIGVIVRTSPLKTSQKGSKYLTWNVSDLKGEIKTISMMLFAGAASAFVKTLPGTVIGVLNPSVMNSSYTAKKEEVTISVDNAQKVLIIGKSIDFGFCKSKKKDGTACSMIVNKYVCELCIYHAQAEYKKSSRRSELQSATGGHIKMRNKVLGKSEVFYGGQSFTAVPAKQSKKQTKKDNMTLQNLSGIKKTMKPKVNDASHPLLSNEVDESKKLNKSTERIEPIPQGPGGKRVSIFKQRLETSAKMVPTDMENASKETAFSLLSRIKAKKEAENNGVIKSSESKTSSSPAINRTPTSSSIVSEVTANASSSTSLLSRLKANKKENTSSEVTKSIKSKMTEKSSSTIVNETPKSFSTKTISPESTSKPQSSKKVQETIAKPRSYDAKLSAAVKNKSSNDKSTNSAKQDIMKATNTFVPRLTEPSEDDDFLSACLEAEEKYCNKISTVQAKKENKNRVLGGKTSSATVTNPADPEFSRLKLNTARSQVSSNPSVFTPLDLNTEPTIEFSSTSNFGKKRSNPKINALNFIKHNGPLIKVDPNAIKKKATTDKVMAIKRKCGFSPRDDAKPLKSAKTDDTSARFKKLIEVTSKHQNLIEAANREAQDEYFDKLEQKEKIEEKLLSTYSVPCKAVFCRQCNYTAFSSSDLCKKENHRIKVVDAVKRFFKCHHCRDRTVCLTIVPVNNCKCGKSTWERAPMIAEKKSSLNSLSICGNNEKQYNPSEANLNLLVPE